MESSKIMKLYFFLILATIGGSIGFGFGVSFVTCFEFVFFIYDYLVSSMKKITKDGTTDVVSSS